MKCLDNFEVEHVLGSDYVHTSDLFNDVYEYGDGTMRSL